MKKVILKEHVKRLNNTVQQIFLINFYTEDEQEKKELEKVYTTMRTLADKYMKELMSRYNQKD